MQTINLFRTQQGKWITNIQLLETLHKVGVPGAKVLFMHAGMTFGQPNPEIGRQAFMAALFDVIAALEVPSLCVPTFTFSFCNGENFDVKQSKSKMGALNEYIRKMEGTVRSIDPLMSVALRGKDRDLVENLGHASIGDNSMFDKLHHRQGVRFLFFGASLSECFTYLHYVEVREKVPYRYNREFSGQITDGDRTYQDAYTLFVRYRGVIPSSDGMLERDLLARKILRKMPCGDGFIACIDEPPAYEVVAHHLRSNIDSFLDHPYPRQGLDSTFEAHNMVAL